MSRSKAVARALLLNQLQRFIDEARGEPVGGWSEEMNKERHDRQTGALWVVEEMLARLHENTAAEILRMKGGEQCSETKR